MNLDEKIIKNLYDNKIVQKSELVNVFKIHKANNEPLEKLVVKLKVIKPEDVLKAKAQVLNAEPYPIEFEKINKEIAKNIPQAMAKRYNLICPDLTPDGRMIIAMHDPNDTFALEYVQMRTGKDIKPYVTLLSDLDNAWDYIYSTEKKLKHPFFAREAEEPAYRKKDIPDKFIIPGITKKSTVVTEDRQKVEESIQKATDTVLKDQEKEIVKVLKDELNALSVLSRSSIILNSSLDEEEIITHILKTGTSICDAQGGSILLLEDEQQFLYFKEAISPKRQQLMKSKIPVSEKSIAGWVVINRQPVAANNLENDPRHYKEVDKRLDFQTRNLACVPLLWGETVLGVMEMVNKKDGGFTEQDLEYLSVLASQASVALHNYLVMEQFKNFYMEVVEILIDCLDIMNPVSRDHSLQVARLTSSIARKLNLPQEEYETLCYAAFLHDIGKMKVTEDNMHMHVTEGARMISHIKFFKKVAPIIRYHHEKFDGSGYPDGLSGESIPAGARILSIAESYIEGREESFNLSEKEYYNQFLQLFGKHYDPGLKTAFIEVIEQKGKEETTKS